VVVEKECARPEYGHFVCCEADHFGLTKPKSAEDVIYQETIHYLIEVLTTAKEAYKLQRQLDELRITKAKIEEEEEKLRQQKGFTIERGFQMETGFLGNLERSDAESRLKDAPAKTFLTRWSTRNKSYVLSFVDSEKPRIIKHIASIIPTSDDRLKVITAEGIEHYSNLREFIITMIKNEVIDQSISDWDYRRTPINIKSKSNS